MENFAIQKVVLRLQCHRVSERVQRERPCYVFLQMLTKAPLSRPGNTSEQRQSLKDDPFFATVDWPALYERSLVPPELPKHCKYRQIVESFVCIFVFEAVGGGGLVCVCARVCVCV